jgi:hypothetical protein
MHQKHKKQGNIPVLVLLFFSGFICQPAYPQFYTTGEDPSHIRWDQIQSDHFQLIFPEEFVDEASRLCGLLEYYYPYNSACLNHSPSKIAVVLHNQSVLSNGFVAWAPKRMELVPVPAPDNNTDDYLSHLALHEFRHVVQVDKMKQGITKGMYYLLGQQSYGVSGLMPLWYLEGDAVDAETRLSHSGRGRLPAFEMEIKAILAENKKQYPYEKAYYGSYRDHIPDYYQYGYQMVAHARNKYGNELWENLLNYTARKPYTLYPFDYGLKKYAGLSNEKLYRETFDILGDHWNKQAENRKHNDFRVINKPGRRHYTSYRYPAYVGDSLIFAEKSGIDQINEFIFIDSAGRETSIHTPGFSMPGNITVAGNRIAWAEVITDIRWLKRNYSVIKIFDLSSGKEKVLAWRTKYFSPDLSSDGQKIVVVAVDTRNRYAMVILDANNGLVLDSLPSPDNRFLQYPVWGVNDREIFVTALSEQGKCLMKYDCEQHDWQCIFQSGFENIAELCSSPDYLLFRGTFSGIDNIYAFEYMTGKVFQVTSSRFGAFYPEVSTDAAYLIYSDYTSKGFNVVETEFNPVSWIPLEDLPEKNEQLNIPSPEDIKNIPVYTGSPDQEYEVKPYRKYANLFNFHSWSPFYFNYNDPDLEQVNVSPGVSLLSQNKLGTAITLLGYEYAGGEHYLHSSFIYTGFFPVLKAGVDYGGLPIVAEPPETEQIPQKIKTELNYRFEVSLPVNLTVNRMISGVHPSAEATYNRTYFFYTHPWGYHSGITYMNYRFYAYSYLKTSMRDILPQWGCIGDIRYVDTPFENEQIGSAFAASGTVYLPGFTRHHTLRTNISYQKQDPAKYIFNNLLAMPRGIDAINMLQMSRLTMDYVFPLVYPDIRLGSYLAYIKRIRAALFYDYATGEDKQSNEQSFQSAGLDLTADVHLFRILFPFNTGVRLIYLPDDNEAKAELIFSVDLNRF